MKLYGKRGLEFAPGSRWAYSNYGFILLGVVIEKVSGQSYYDYVRAHIYAAAGMTRTGSLPEDQAVSGRSIGYTEPPGTTGWVPNTDTLPYSGTSAGGGYSTVEDLARFAHALLSHKLLSPDATKLLITGKVWAPPLGVRYAYGFEDARAADGSGWVGHGGGAPGMNGDRGSTPSPATWWRCWRTSTRPRQSGSRSISIPGYPQSDSTPGPNRIGTLRTRAAVLVGAAAISAPALATCFPAASDRRRGSASDAAADQNARLDKRLPGMLHR